MTYCKKKCRRIWIWIAVDRNRNKIVDFEIGNRGFSTYLRMAKRLKKAYQIRVLCTDGWKVYRKISISKTHFIGKSETSLIESKNSLIRNYLARFNRKTKRYSKSITMIFLSLKLLFFKLNSVCF